MPDIIRVYVEQLPQLKLIGKRYGDGDRDEKGSFASKWEAWNREHRCKPLLPLLLPNEEASSLVGWMRCVDGVFEYWIGRFCRPDAKVPEGYAGVDLPATKVAVAWIRGHQGDPAIYAMHGACVAAVEAAEHHLAEPSWFFERYVLSRFMTLDEDRQIVLDYGVAIRD